MKRLFNIFACTAAAVVALSSCEDSLSIESPQTEEAAQNSNVLSTKSGIAVVTLSQNPQYFNGALIPSINAVGLTELTLTITVPADGTFTGVSVRSASGKGVSGTFSISNGTALMSERDMESITFAEFPKEDGSKYYELKKGDIFSFTLPMPPIDYPANDLIVRLHATGNKIYESPVSTAVRGGKAVSVSITPAAQNGNNWITALPDDALVSELSIPGTHDAATGDGTTFSLGKTQSLTLQKQWEMGVRMFDLRPGYKKVRTGLFKYVDKLHIYHGMVETKTSFEDAINTLCNNLASNPDEFAVIVMRFENDHLIYNDSDVWNELMTSFLSSSSFPAECRVDFRPDLTVGELRGKILVLSRNAYASTPSTGAFVSGWSHDSNGSTGARISGKNSSATLYIQDYYSVDDSNQKNAVVKNFANKAAVAPAGVWTINHTSGYTGSLASDSAYKKNAANTNSTLYNYITSSEKPVGGTGIIVMDHVGSRKSGSYTVYGDLLPQAVIDNNYKFRLGRKGE